MTVEEIARVCHEANRAYCLSHGDLSHAPWAETDQALRDSVCSGVAMILNNPETTPEESHQGWLDYKTAEGWVWGEVKLPELKQHPCMLPYDQLPPEQRVKDEIFAAIVGVLR